MKKLMAFSLLCMAGLTGQYAPTTSVAMTDDAASLALNPAGLGVSRGFNMLLLTPVDFTRLDSVQSDFSAFFHGGVAGAGYTYKGDGLDLFHWGSGEHIWGGIHVGSTAHFSKDGYEAVDLGLLYRGFPWFSAGLTWKNVWARERGARADQGLALGIAFRPFGNRFTFAYDLGFSFEAESFAYRDDLSNRVQISAELLDGVRLFGSYDDRLEGVQLGLGIGFGRVSVETYHDTDKGSGYLRSLTGIHVSEQIRRAVYRKRTPTFVELSFERPITDSPAPRAFFGPKTVTLRELIRDIEEMANNPEIDGIILKPDRYVTGSGMLEEVHKALLKFKESGKKVFAFIDQGGDIAYALAAVADSVYLNSGGMIAVDGLALGVLFFKSLFDKIGVEAQFYRRGDYKTAGEIYTRDSLTETSREAYEVFLADMQSVFSGMILRGRGWSQDKLMEVYNNALYTAEMALEAGVVDGIYHPDQIKKKMEKIAGEEVKIVKVDRRPTQWAYDWKSAAAPKIAVIYAEGPIYPGKSEPSPFGGDRIIGSETTAREIREAREDKSVKAIVMRVNSPGGSIQGSEEIWREVHRTTHPDSADEENQKPFIVSMADLAGSGGYYIACAADAIVADSSTLTGSIGVALGKVSVGGLFKKIGLNLDIVKEHPHAEQFGPHRPFTENESQRMQAMADRWYELFLGRVAEGRGMTLGEVDTVAQGRIWSGVDAKDLGLVDELGGLNKAIEIARERAGLEEGKYQTVIYKGVAEKVFKFKMEAGSDLVSLLDTFELGIPLSRLLDRAKLFSDEPFLYLMEGELIVAE